MGSLSELIGRPSYNDAQKHEGFVGFEKACSRVKTYVIQTFISMHLMLMASIFVKA